MNHQGRVKHPQPSPVCRCFPLRRWNLKNKHVLSFRFFVCFYFWWGFCCHCCFGVGLEVVLSVWKKLERYWTEKEAYILVISLMERRQRYGVNSLTAFKVKHWNQGWRDGSVHRNTALMQGTWVWFPEPMDLAQLTKPVIPAPGDTFFWPLWTFTLMYTYVIPPLKIKLDLKKKLKPVANSKL